MKLPIFSLICAPLVAMPIMAIAQQPAADLADLVGGRGAGGEAQLQARGFNLIKTDTSGTSKYGYWWNGRQNRCVIVRTEEGRYASIVDAPSLDCGKSGNAGPSNYAVGREEPPQVVVGGNGEGEVIFRRNNCVVYYSARGVRTRSLPSCTAAQRAQAAVAMASYRREQGADGSVADHSPVYRDFTSNRINLICHGDGERLTFNDRHGYVWDDRRQRYIPQSIPGYGNEQYDAFVTIQLNGDRGRIRLPQSMVPPINSGGTRGWWDLDNIRYSSSRITARYRFNGLNRPTLTINRRTGAISIAGLNRFNGSCVALDRGGNRWR